MGAYEGNRRGGRGGDIIKLNNIHFVLLGLFYLNPILIRICKIANEVLGVNLSFR
jgi:hypothetical protein